MCEDLFQNHNPATDAYERFVRSIHNLSLEDWREGEGYRPDALAEIRKKERPLAIQLLSDHLEPGNVPFDRSMILVN